MGTCSDGMRASAHWSDMLPAPVLRLVAVPQQAQQRGFSESAKASHLAVKKTVQAGHIPACLAGFAEWRFGTAACSCDYGKACAGSYL